MREYTVKVFFVDGTSLGVDCDDFRICEKSYYTAISDGLRIMTFPLCAVKYTVIVNNKTDI